MVLTPIQQEKHRGEPPIRREAKNIQNVLCGLVSGLLVSLRGVGLATMLLLCVVLPGMTPTTVAAGNLITDGGFEVPLTGTLVGKRVGSKIGGWTVIGPAKSTFLVSLPAWKNIPAREGKVAVHIGGYLRAGGVSRSFATRVGARYQISLWAVNSPNRGTGTGKVRVHGGGELLNQQFKAPAPPSWKQSSFSFTARASTTTIEIQNVSGGLTIDDVTITPALVGQPAAAIATPGQPVSAKPVNGQNVTHIDIGTGKMGEVAPGVWLRIGAEGWKPSKFIEESRNESSIVLSHLYSKNEGRQKYKEIYRLDLRRKRFYSYNLYAQDPISRIYDPSYLSTASIGVGRFLDTSSSSANLVNRLVKQFAPILNFDRAAEEYPMSAQDFYEKIDPVTGNFVPNKVQGKISNTDPASLKNGKTPVYYQIRAVGPKAQVRIRYWWFFGYQASCNESGDGRHHGDWEGIMVTLKEDLSGVAAVTYWLHGAHYTRNAAPKGICSPEGTGRCSGSRGFDAIVDGRPGVWIGKVGHGSYHDSNSRGPGGCGYWAEWRNPASQADRMDTQFNLMNLDLNSEPWMVNDATATFPWGPDGVSTHPKATNRNEQAGPPTALMRSCTGSAEYKEAGSACYKSECLAGDDETSSLCLKECPPGYSNHGLTCYKSVIPPKFYGRLNPGKSYSYEYTIPTDDWGLVKNGQWWKTE